MRFRLAALVLAPLMVSAVLVSPATAGDIDRCPSASALMTVSDIPAWLSKNPKREASCRLGAKSNAPYLCINTAGTDIYGRKPHEQSNATIVLGGNETLSVERTAFNSIYGYTSKPAGAAAWKYLRQQAQTCPASSSATRTTPGVTVQITQKTSRIVLPALMGRRGLAFAQRVKVVATGTVNFTVHAANYTVYRPVGRFIVKVEFNASTRVAAPVSVAAQQRAWTRSEAVRVARRLLHVA